MIQDFKTKFRTIREKVRFRFQDLEIWEISIEIAMELFKIADRLEEKKLFRFAEQLRASGMSMSNNIAEGSGSFSDKDFSNFLNFTRRSIFENANILIVIYMLNHIDEEKLNELLEKLDILSRKITNFRNTLK